MFISNMLCRIRTMILPIIVRPTDFEVCLVFLFNICHNSNGWLIAELSKKTMV